MKDAENDMHEDITLHSDFHSEMLLCIGCVLINCLHLNNESTAGADASVEALKL